jgi:alkyl sulfatase BDS1-like metallo-beta-lactamase superfamily hydrolase
MGSNNLNGNSFMFKSFNIFTAMLLSIGLLGAAIARSDQYGMSLKTELATAANGAVTTVPQANVDKDWDVAEKKVTEVVEGVYRIGGWGIGNVIAIEGPEGWLIIDTGDDAGAAADMRAALEEKVGRKIQVAGIAYTHTHYVWGASAWMDEGTELYAHEDMLPNLLADNGISALSGNFSARMVVQFGMLHPTEGPDAFPSKLGFSADKLTGEKGFVPPTVTFKDGEIETHQIAGLTVEVLPSPTDVLDSVAYHFPAKKLLVSNAMNGALDDGANVSLFNIYTLRGDIYRDPMRLVAAADLALSRDPEVMVDIHGPARVGKENVRAAIEWWRDSMQLIYDQTYRGIGMGKDAQEIAEWIYLPEDVRAGNETYGQVESHARQVYNARVGWMGWDPYDINPLPKAEQAARVVEAMGGIEAVTAQARAAVDKGDIASSQWALYLTTQLQDMGALQGDSRQARADASRTLGQHTTSANARGFYISEALLHEGKVAFGGQAITDYRELNAVFGAVTADKLAASPLNDNVQYLRFMVDSRLAEGKRAEFNVNFNDEGVSYAIALRNGVIAITGQSNDGKTFEMSKADWDDLILGTRSFASLDASLEAFDAAIDR